MPDKKPDFSNVVGGSSSTAATPGSSTGTSPGNKPDFSNVVTGSSSTAATPAGAPVQGRTYVVQKGDSLSKIAKKFYGNANEWKRIHEANKSLIKNPDLIQPGWTLTIPD